MAEFCSCGSLVVNSNCTNKKCKQHRNTPNDLASYNQISYIQEMVEKLKDEREIDYKNLTKNKANKIIKEFEEKLKEMEGEE